MIQSPILVAPTLDDRYSRQSLFSEIGEAGQERIHAARVLVMGCGGLGTVTADMLARAGVGFIRIVDRDYVELSNLQRQSLFDERDVRARTPKAIAAARRLKEINSGLNVEAIVTDAEPHNILDLMRGVDIVLDGLDSFESRYLVNDACVSAGIPWIYGGCVGSYGVTMAIVPGRTPCLRCVFPEVPPIGSMPTCDTSGILSSIVHVIAAIQTASALRWIVTGEPPERNSVVSIDVWGYRCERLTIDYNAESSQCPCCAARRFDYLESSGAQTTAICGRDSVQVSPIHEIHPDFDSLSDRLRPLGEVDVNEYLLHFISPPYEMTLFGDGRAIVSGTTDAAQARSLVSRYFGV